MLSLAQEATEEGGGGEFRGEWRTLSEGEAAERDVEITSEDAWSLGKRLRKLPGRTDAAVVEKEGRKKRLLAADMDGTVLSGETLDEVAREVGVWEEASELTRRAMEGELDFVETLRERMKLLGATRRETWASAARGIRLTRGVRTLTKTMKREGARTILVSGGFDAAVATAADRGGFDEYRANRLTRGGEWDEAAGVMDAKGKAAALGDEPWEALALGDGMNDVLMLERAGLGLAFRAKASLSARVRHEIVSSDMRTALYYQGYGRGEWA